uniref:MAM domain-containing protein n=1 Tax=Macrostomum lignano TaxID=282301 RepID=A0A1I8GEJ7_9PLAT
SCLRLFFTVLKAKRFLKPELNCFVFQNPFGIFKIALSQFGDMTASNPGCRSILLTLVLLFSCLSGLWSADAAGELQQQQQCNFGLICEFKNWPNNADNWQLGGYSAQSASLPSTSVAQLMTESTSESALHIAKLAIGSNCITFRYWLSSAELSISVRQASSGRRLRRMMLWQQRADDGDDNGWQQGQLMLDAEAGDSAELVIAGSALLSGRRSVVRIADLAIRKGGSVGEVADCPTMPPQAPAAVAVPAVVRFGDIGGFDCDFNDNLCGWTNDPDGDFNWERERLITGNTVITADSTGNKDGKYMFPKPVGPSNGKKCRLLSPTFDGTQVYCLSFFYYINSNFLAGINVYWANGDTLGEPIFSIFEEKDKRWFEARLNLFGDSSRSDRNRIVFEGVGGRLRIVTVAFERTALTRGSCDG